MAKIIALSFVLTMGWSATAQFSTCEEAYSYIYQLRRDFHSMQLILQQKGNWQELYAMGVEAQNFLDTHGSCHRHAVALNAKKTPSVAEREQEIRRLEILRETQRREPSRSQGRYWECYKPENYTRCGVGNAP